MPHPSPPLQDRPAEPSRARHRHNAGRDRRQGSPGHIGVLGGMGPRATHHFVERLLSAVEQHVQPKCDQEYPEITVRYGCSIPDRTACIEGDPNALRVRLNAEIAALRHDHCHPIVIPCITAHAFLDKDAHEQGVLDVRDATAAWIATRHPNTTVGVLGTRGARKAGVLNRFCPRSNPVTLSPQQEEDVMRFIYEGLKRPRSRGDLSVVQSAAAGLRAQGADVIVLGCTELEMFVGGSTSADHPHLIRPLEIVARTIASELGQSGGPRDDG